MSNYSAPTTDEMRRKASWSFCIKARYSCGLSLDLRDAANEIDTLRDALSRKAAMKARPLNEWHDDDGPVLWWKFPVQEPPYVGTPHDIGYTVELSAITVAADIGPMSFQVGGWPGYHTHWTALPDAPTEAY